MILLSDSRCLAYETPGHPERPARIAETRAFLKATHPEWEWGSFSEASEKDILRAHSSAHLRRLQVARHFDADTAYHDGIFDLAKLSCGASLAAMSRALRGEKAFSLMRPPGHHAEREQAMGFCYINNIAVCALKALSGKIKRVAIWDFDAHHGNGTEAILGGVEGVCYVSVHQHPCYPGTGSKSLGNYMNFPVLPLSPPEEHMKELEASWQAVLDFRPQLVLVSAGFDAYENDPITQMTLRQNDFETLGTWLRAASLPTAALLEGGYSDQLPQLINAFLEGWDERA